MMIKLLLTVVLTVTGLWLYVRFLEKTTIFLPAKVLRATPQDMGLPFDDVYFPTEDGVTLNGWFIPARERPERMATLLFFHGNAGNIGDRLEKIAVFYQMGLNVMIVDYRGYGNSEGQPSESGMYADARAAFDYLLTREDIRQDRIVVYGVSLGGAAATAVAAQRQPAAVILDSTFTSAKDMARGIAPFVPAVFLSVRLDNLEKISKITVPKLFIHSPQDETVPYALGRALFAEAPEPKEFLEIKGDHNGGFSFSQATFTGGIKVFLRKFGLLPL